MSFVPPGSNHDHLFSILNILVNASTNNTPSVTTYSIGDTTPVTIASADPDRLFLAVQLSPGSSEVDVFIRPYPAATNTTKHGITVLTRNTMDGALYHPYWDTSHSLIVPHSEFSAITLSGTVDIYVTEF